VSDSYSRLPVVAAFFPEKFVISITPLLVISCPTEVGFWGHV
jgi:hypothetical protein